MAKILLACDMEGITGVSRWEHVSPNHAEYQRFRALMTQDVNAVVEGAFAGGAQEVEIADGHSSGQNLLIEALDPRAVLNSGTSSPWSMMNGINDQFDAVMFVGYHAMAGTAQAVLAHTWMEEVLSWKINGRPVGEFGMNTLIAGSFGVPAILASGDQSLAAEVKTFVPGIETVVVKQAAGYFSAKCYAPERTHALLAAGAKRAVEGLIAGNAPEPLKVQFPADLEVAFIQPHMAEFAARLPRSERIDGRTVKIQVDDPRSAFQAARAFCNLAV
jgi:D-amino peptidase